MKFRPPEPKPPYRAFCWLPRIAEDTGALIWLETAWFGWVDVARYMAPGVPCPGFVCFEHYPSAAFGAAGCSPLTSDL